MSWEMAGIAAQATGRTLVLPPERDWYLLPGEPSEVAKFINLPLLKKHMDVLTHEEFLEREGKALNLSMEDFNLPYHAGDARKYLAEFRKRVKASPHITTIASD